MVGFFFAKSRFLSKIIIGREKKVAHDKPHMKTDIVCKFQVNQLGSLGGESVTDPQTDPHTDPHTDTKPFIYIRDYEPIVDFDGKI